MPQNPKAGLAPKSDDWSALKPITALVPSRTESGTAPAPAQTSHSDKQDDDPANAGLRREPGLEPHKDIAPEPERPPANEFDPDLDESDHEANSSRALMRNMRQAARQISMDPGDGMEL